MLEHIGKFPQWARWCMLLAGCAIFFFLWLMPVPLTEVDEARFTEASREMLESGNWIIPHFNYEPRYRKPVLFYWLQAGSFKLFGQNEVAARVPSATASTLLVLMLYVFLSIHLQDGAKDEKSRSRARGAAFLGSAALILSPIVAIWSRGSITDPTLTLWITASLLCILQSDLESSAGRHTAHWYVLAGAFAGLAFLTKGPIGLAIPGITWIAYHVIQGDLRKTAKGVPWLRTLGMFTLVAVPWYVATYVVDGPAFLKWFFLRENVGRYTTTMEGHGISNPVFGMLGYLGIALLGLFPASPFLLREAISPFSSCSSDMDDRLKRMRRFGWVWFSVVIGIFAASKTQLPAYIQSIAGAAGMLFAIHVYARLRPDKAAQPGWKAVVETSLLIFVGMLWTYLPIYVLPKGAVQGGILGTEMFPQPTASILLWLCAGAGMLLILNAVIWRVRRDDDRLIGRIMATWAVLLAGIILGIMPIVIRSLYLPTKDIGRYLSLLPKDDGITVYCKKSPESLVFYSMHRIEFWDRGAKENRTLVEKAFPKGYVFVTDPEGLKTLRTLGDVETMHVSGNITVARMAAKKAGTYTH